jgi:hypothetical protein
MMANKHGRKTMKKYEDMFIASSVCQNNKKHKIA